MRKQGFSVGLDKEVLETLQEIADAEHFVSVGAVIRAAIDQYIETFRSQEAEIRSYTQRG